jgi:hypothetical protein
MLLSFHFLFVEYAFLFFLERKYLEIVLKYYVYSTTYFKN